MKKVIVPEINLPVYKDDPNSICDFAKDCGSLKCDNCMFALMTNPENWEIIREFVNSRMKYVD